MNSSPTRTTSPLRSVLATVALLAASLPAGAVVVTPPAGPPVGPSATDIWDVTQGGNVTAGSPVLVGTDLRNIFGATAGGTPEGNAGNTLFGPDGQPGGTTYFVEWSTPVAHAIESFVLSAQHDGLPRDANARGIRAFRLYAYNVGTNAFDITLFDLDLDLAPNGNRYDPLGTIHACQCFLDFSANVDQVVNTNRWRAEFDQFGFFAFNASSPRILELDGYTTPLLAPAPAPAALLALGLLAIAARRRRL